MRTIYIDSDFKCHAAFAEGLTAVETDFFDRRCDAFLEGYRCIPEGEYWTREDGKVFTNQITPWKDYAILEAYQQQYEAMTAELAAAYQEGVNSV